ncbi:MAG: UDP-N-acetylmuramate dehydrogenase [Actinobacteria bacterium]|nr:UDP-N-acetylmuramate dehydrogenase [Actinomycetota bacterium]MBO0786916.1 UDP-N-acetylmuramate dehydrogenase [Actinomycetota bacterium]
MGLAGEQVELREHTTLRLGGPARRFLTGATEDEVVAAVAAADECGEPVLVLGGGSNLVVSDQGFPGTVIRVATRGIRVALGAGKPAARLTVAAGEDWDHVVATCVSNGLAGLECLSGIPGRAGATPIQNVGAYGQEVAETITRVRGYDRERREIVELTGADCGFGYRTSAFKRQAQAAAAADGAAAATGKFVVLAVTFQLTRSELSGPVRYGELARTLGIGEGDRAPLADVRAAVLGLRRGKGMVLDPADPDTRSAGSFFINPVLDEAQFAALGQVVAGRGAGSRIPCYPAPDGKVKVSAAWLIEQAGFRKGYPGNGTDGPRISAKHTLALVNPGGATAASLAGLAREVRDGVRQAFGVELLPEPVLVGPGLALLSG